MMNDDEHAGKSIQGCDGVGVGVTLEPDTNDPVVLLWLAEDDTGMLGAIFSPGGARQFAAVVCNFADEVDELMADMQFSKLSDEEVAARLDKITKDFGQQ